MVPELRDGSKESTAPIGILQVIFLISVVGGGAMALYAAFDRTYIALAIYSFAALILALCYGRKNSRIFMMSFVVIVLIIGIIVLGSTNFLNFNS